MCGDNSKSQSYDYGAAKRAADAEAAKLQAEKDLAERTAELKTMSDKQAQAEAEMQAKAERRSLLQKVAFGDDTEDEEDTENPTTRATPKAAKSILKGVE